MNLTQFSLARNRLTLVLLFVILVGGLASYFSLPQSEDPDFVIRTALVVTYFPGAGPERVEQLVTDKIEQGVQEIPELDNVTSQSRTGVSLVYVNIKEKYSDMRPIWRKLRDKVDDARTSLPEGIDGPYVQDDFGDVFGIMIALTGEGFSQAELDTTAREVRKDLLQVPTVARVEIMGEQEEKIFVEFSNARLAELGLSPAVLADTLQTENIVLPGGYVNVGPEKIVVEPTGNYESVEDLRNTVIRLSQAGRPDRLIYLKDIAAVTRGYVDPPDTIVHYDGVPAVLIAVNMSRDGNIVELGRAIEGRLREMEADLPVGMEFSYAAFQPRYVTEAINDFMVNLLEGVAAVVIVMLLFLGLRTGLVVGTLIPMTMLLTFLWMSVFGVGLQQVSIASLIIALGMLVDNAIVMSEDIMVRIQRGQERLAAAAAAGKELAVPLLTATLTTSAAFLAIYLADSAVGEYCASLFQVVTMALVSSWFLALTMIPLFCVWFLRVSPASAPNFEGGFYRRYRRWLTCLLRYRLLTVAALLAVFIGSLGLFALVPQIFFPPSVRPQFVIDFWLPEGTHLDQTYREMLPVEEFLGARDEVENFSMYVGESSPRFYLSLNQEQSNENYGFFLVNCVSVEGMDVLMADVYRMMRSTIPAANPVVKKLETGAMVGAPIQVRISGNDISAEGIRTMYRLASGVRDVLRETPGVISIRDSWGSPIKKLYVRVDQARARRAGLTSQDIAVSLHTQLAGYQATQYREKDQVIPVDLRSVRANRTDLAKLEGLNIYSLSGGNSVPLLQIARPEFRSEVSTVERRNRRRNLTVKCDVTGRTASEVLAEIRPRLDALAANWPSGYSVEYGGEFEENEKASQSIFSQLPISIFIILMLLVWQFNSFRKTLIIFLTIPMGLIGAILGLFVTGSEFGFMSMLGMVSLAGIVVNNAIVLIDRIDLEIGEGKSPQEAILVSGQKRLRPILLTTITTLGGLLPLALQGGPLWESMAWTIIGGLLFATVLTLGFVPVLYSLFFRVRIDLSA